MHIKLPTSAKVISLVATFCFDLAGVYLGKQVWDHIDHNGWLANTCVVVACMFACRAVRMALSIFLMGRFVEVKQ